MNRIAWISLAAVVAVALFCGGCADKQFTRARYETIYVGQPQFEVEATLGKPAARFSDSWTYLNEEPFYKAIIKFQEGKVVDKAWADSKVIEDMPYNKRPANPNPPVRTAPGGSTVVQ